MTLVGGGLVRPRLVGAGLGVLLVAIACLAPGPEKYGLLRLLPTPLSTSMPRRNGSARAAAKPRAPPAVVEVLRAQLRASVELSGLGYANLANKSNIRLRDKLERVVKGVLVCAMSEQFRPTTMLLKLSPGLLLNATASFVNVSHASGALSNLLEAVSSGELQDVLVNRTANIKGISRVSEAEEINVTRISVPNLTTPVIPEQTIAVCATGHLRSFVLPGVAQSWANYLLRDDAELRTDLYIVAKVDWQQNKRYGIKFVGNTSDPKLQNALKVLRKWTKHVSLKKVTDREECAHIEQFWKAARITGRRCYGENGAYQVLGIDQCFTVARRAKATYSHIVRVRPDIAFFQPLPYDRLSDSKLTVMHDMNPDMFWIIPSTLLVPYWDQLIVPAFSGLIVPAFSGSDDFTRGESPDHVMFIPMFLPDCSHDKASMRRLCEQERPFLGGYQPASFHPNGFSARTILEKRDLLCFQIVANVSASQCKSEAKKAKCVFRGWHEFACTGRAEQEKHEKKRRRDKLPVFGKPTRVPATNATCA